MSTSLPDMVALLPEIETNGVSLLRSILERDPLAFTQTFGRLMASTEAVLFGEVTDSDLRSVANIIAAAIRKRVRQQAH